VKARPNATLQELRAWLLETHKVSASIKLICKPRRVAVDAKKKTLHAAEQNRADVAQARTEWREL
jgi:hypothetical protein